jgi:hypothetical protein
VLGYHVDRAREVAANDGEIAAYGWLGVDAWFEGGLDECFRTIPRMMTHGN